MSHFPLYHCIYTGSPNITSLVLNRDTNSLICISSGGPATKVIWMKNNLPLFIDGIHYRHHQTVVDSESAVYINTLYNVDQTSLVGTFTCTVENVRGRSTKSMLINGENLFMQPAIVITIYLLCRCQH